MMKIIPLMYVSLSFRKMMKIIPLSCVWMMTSSPFILVESNELMQIGWKMTGFHDDAIQRILNLLGFCLGGGGLLGFRICSTSKNMVSTHSFRGFLRKNLGP
jgi:hypothetical protein